MRIIVFYLVLLTGFLNVFSEKCSIRDYGRDRKVCVCNKNSCDTIDPVRKIQQGSFLKYTSNKKGQRLEKDIGYFSNSSKTTAKIVVKTDEVYQKIVGFGGAFTDSTGINIMSLEEDVRNKLMMSYFSEKGIEYSIGRVPIAATDFSTHPYTYHDEEDITLSNFSLAAEDYKYKLPLLYLARNLTNNKIQFFASAWIAPLWMKSNDQYNNGPLKQNMYQVWADYSVKFLDAYKKQGISFWAITTGNEPFTGFIPFNKIPSIAWNSSNLKIWLRDNLGPTIRKSSFSNMKILILDDTKMVVEGYVDEIFSDDKAKSYSDGIGIHWYLGGLAPSDLFTKIHNKYPDQLLLATEASEGSVTLQPVQLGLWDRAEDYAYDIIEDINNWIAGWTDWNMVLDLQGGPTYISNFCDSPIIVNASGQEFLKQPMFYAMGHFSKFVPKDSQRIFVSNVSDEVLTTAFKRPDDGVVIVILNRQDKPFETIVEDKNRGSFVLNLTEHSITTIVYW